MKLHEKMVLVEFLNRVENLPSKYAGECFSKGIVDQINMEYSDMAESLLLQLQPYCGLSKPGIMYWRNPADQNSLDVCGTNDSGRWLLAIMSVRQFL